MNDDDEFPATSSGAERQALLLPYMRQLPLEALMAGAVALEYGAEKYSHRNWEKGLPWQQMVDSLKRHLDAFERRQDVDDGPDGSMLPHICLVMSSAMLLVTSVMREIGEDDRLPPLDERAISPKELAKWGRDVLSAARNARDAA